MDWQKKFEVALSYDAFLEKHGKPEHRDRWQGVYDQVVLDEAQKRILGGLAREMSLLCLAGAWCGDCVNQCPIFQRFAEASEKLNLRFLDRDAHMDVQQELSLCGGNRVPVVVFLSEDYQECGRYGDRTLSKYRELAASQLGAACPTGIGGVEQSLLQAVTAEWLAELERTQLMLRLSPRLREKYGD
jgi:thiol-disulfide isomerase/thioredoxin